LEAFKALQQALTTTAVLMLLDFIQTFCIEMDASAIGVGAVLMQHGHSLAFLSKALGPYSHGLLMYKEYMAIHRDRMGKARGLSMELPYREPSPCEGMLARRSNKD
jgi:hypothetical protein